MQILNQTEFILSLNNSDHCHHSNESKDRSQYNGDAFEAGWWEVYALELQKQGRIISWCACYYNIHGPWSALCIGRVVLDSGRVWSVLLDWISPDNSSTLGSIVRARVGCVLGLPWARSCLPHLLATSGRTHLLWAAARTALLLHATCGATLSLSVWHVSATLSRWAALAVYSELIIPC